MEMRYPLHLTITLTLLLSVCQFFTNHIQPPKPYSVYFMDLPKMEEKLHSPTSPSVKQFCYQNDITATPSGRDPSGIFLPPTSLLSSVPNSRLISTSSLHHLPFSRTRSFQKQAALLCPEVLRAPAHYKDHFQCQRTAPHSDFPVTHYVQKVIQIRAV